MAFGEYQNEIYLNGLLTGEHVALPVDWRAREEAAGAAMTPQAEGYVAGAAGSERTAAANLAAFDRWRIVPRFLRDVSHRDVATEVLGIPLQAPVALAPVGVLEIVHPEAELAVARACAETGTAMVLSSAASSTMEDVAAALGNAPGLFQLYWPKSRDIAASFVRRAEAAGYRAIVVTLDTTILAWRPRDLQTAYLPFLERKGVANYYSDPAFRELLGGTTPEEDPGNAVLTWAGQFANPALCWDDLPFLREHTSLPIVLKGVLHPDDARRAVDAGVDGLVVSNHGGRQVDGAIGALDALPGVVEAVDGALPVLFDSGIRTGADVVKAVSLGAAAALVGRPYVHGLALGGQAGVVEVLRGLLAELDLTMALSGNATLADLGPHVLAPAPT